MKTLRQNISDPAFVQNPYPFYDVARAQGDIVFWDAFDMPAAFSHRAVRMILSDRRLGREKPQNDQKACPAHLTNFAKVEANSLLEIEPPRHTKIRSRVLRAFTGRAAAHWTQPIETLSENLIENFPSGPFDLLDQFAKPLPVNVIANLLGVPTERSSDLLAWSNAMVRMYTPTRDNGVEVAADKAAVEFHDFLDQHIDHVVHTHSATGLLSDLLEPSNETSALTRAELISTLVLLLNAGHEATVHTIGNAVRLICKYRDQTGTLPAIDEALVEEVLRFDPPLHVFTRYVYEDVDCFGTMLKAGTEVACVLAAANRDPTVFPLPHEFNPSQKPGTHQSFGAGIHFCVGAPLARLEILIALRTLFAKHPNLTLVHDPEFADSYHFHGLNALTVRA